MTDWISIVSSNLSAIKTVTNEYDDLVTLTVEFRDGHVYEYYDVQPKRIEDMLAHESPGAYFRDYIRGSYDLEQLR